jgi:hypothetical protein
MELNLLQHHVSLVRVVLNYCPEAVFSARLVCRGWMKAAADEGIWKLLFWQTFPGYRSNVYRIYERSIPAAVTYLYGNLPCWQVLYSYHNSLCHQRTVLYFVGHRFVSLSRDGGRTLESSSEYDRMCSRLNELCSVVCPSSRQLTILGVKSRLLAYSYVNGKWCNQYCFDGVKLLPDLTAAWNPAGDRNEFRGRLCVLPPYLFDDLWLEFRILLEEGIPHRAIQTARRDFPCLQRIRFWEPT